MSEFSTDGTLVDASDAAVPTERPVKTYVDTLKTYVDGYVKFRAGDVPEPTTLGQDNDRTEDIAVSFLAPFVSAPLVLLSISRLAISKNEDIAFSVQAIAVTRTGFIARFHKTVDGLFRSSKIRGIAVKYIAIGV